MPKRGKPRCKRAGFAGNVTANFAMSPLITPSCEVANTVVEAAVSSTCRNSPVAFHETFPVRGSYVVREPDADSSSDDAETVMVTLRPFDGSETVSSLEQAVNRDAHTATAKMDLKKVFIVVQCVC